MDQKKTFDPNEWGNIENENEQKQTAIAPVVIDTSSGTGGLHLEASELDKANAVTEALLGMGANIAEDEDDYYRLLQAMAKLGEDGKELCRSLCKVSAKYEQRDFEYKWRWARNNGKSSIHLATFYDMAKTAGIDLSAISRQFPSPGFSSNPQFPHGSVSGSIQHEKSLNNNSQQTNNQIINSRNMTSSTSINTATHGGEETEEMRFSFSRSFSQNIDETKLPQTIQRTLSIQKTATDKDKVLLATLDLLAMAEPNVYGIYGGKRVYTPFYLFILGPAGISQKGVIADTKQILMPVDESIRAKYYAQLAEYKEQHAAWEEKKSKRGKNAENAGVEPEEPQFRRIFISADSSAAAFKQDLYNFGGRGIIFSTEADTLSQALSQEWGQFTDSFRQAFHHESIESSRTKDKLRIIIEEPQLGILVTCTPQQIVEMLSPKQSENGTSSRDLFYCTKGHQEWIDPFQAKEPTADYYYEIGKDVKKMYDQLENRSKNRIQILISDEKRQAFNEHFCPLLPDHIGLYGEDFAAFTVRIALIAFRMMMILTTVRNFEKGNLSDPKQQAFVITDDDYETAMTIIDCLVEHTAYVYKNLLHPSDETLLTIQPLKGREQQFYLSLPDEFTTKVFNEKAEALGIPSKTAQRYMGNFISRYQLIERVRHGYYIKIKRQKSNPTEG